LGENLSDFFQDHFFRQKPKTNRSGFFPTTRPITMMPARPDIPRFAAAAILLQLLTGADAIFFTTVGLTGTAASTAVITQSAALLPVLGLLALAAKVTKLKLASQQDQVSIL
jgi:hypothetical protein